MNWRVKAFGTLAALSFLGAPESAHAQQCIDVAAISVSTKNCRPAPTPTIVRYTENWSLLADRANRRGYWTEPFKYLPLKDDGQIYLTTGFEFRLRSEFYRGIDWGGNAAPDQSFLLARAMPFADLHLGHLRAFVQPIASFAFGVKPDPTSIDRTRIDILQAFADYLLNLGRDTQLRVEVGRQLVSLGAERLVGTRYGPNTPLAFDGARAIFNHRTLTASVFFLVPVKAGPNSFDDRRSRSSAIWGFYATRWLGADHHARFDLYYLGARNNARGFQQGSGREIRQTIGFRSAGRASINWDVEAFMQIGRFAGAPIRAWALAFKAEKIFDKFPHRPELSIQADVASGDHDPSDPTLQSFNSLFPKGKSFGELSPIGPTNIVDIHPSLTLALNRGITLGIAGMAYWRQSVGDGVYDVPGHLLRAGAPGEARFIGKQAELKLKWQTTRELTLTASASHFFPGPFLRESGIARPITMAALEANFRF